MALYILLSLSAELNKTASSITASGLGVRLGLWEDVSLLGVAESGGDDAVRLAGCEGSVSLAWRTGEG